MGNRDKWKSTMNKLRMGKDANRHHDNGGFREWISEIWCKEWTERAGRRNLDRLMAHVFFKVCRGPAVEGGWMRMRGQAERCDGGLLGVGLARRRQLPLRKPKP